MLKVTGEYGVDCEGIGRRSFLQAGALGIGGLSISGLAQIEAQGAVDRHPDERSVILFWLSGGPGHMETWDPKPEAVSQYKGPFDAIETAVPGMLFGELMPNLAKVADQLTVLRGVNHGSGDHTKGKDCFRFRKTA